MIDLGPHTIFIVVSYLGVMIVISLLISWVWTSAKKQQKRLNNLDERGIKRRSDNSDTNS